MVTYGRAAVLSEPGAVRVPPPDGRASPEGTLQLRCYAQQFFYSGEHYLEIDFDVHQYTYLARRAITAYIQRLHHVVWETAFIVQVCARRTRALTEFAWASMNCAAGGVRAQGGVHCMHDFACSKIAAWRVPRGAQCACSDSCCMYWAAAAAAAAAVADAAAMTHTKGDSCKGCLRKGSCKGCSCCGGLSDTRRATPLRSSRNRSWPPAVSTASISWRCVPPHSHVLVWWAGVVFCMLFVSA